MTWTLPVKESFSLKSFGAIGDGVVDDTAALVSFLDFLMDEGEAGYLPKGNYNITSQPQDIISVITLSGHGCTTAQLWRNYTGTAGKGLLHIYAHAGTSLSNFECSAISGTGGHAISIVSSSTTAAGFTNLSNLYLSSYINDAFDNTLLIDGSANTTAIRGVRGVAMQSMRIFGSAGHAVLIKSALDCSWHGGAAYGASGTAASAGGIKITGASGNESTEINISIGSCTGFDLSHLNDSNLQSSLIGSIGGVSVANTNTVTGTCVIGRPTGTVQSNWTTSGIRKPSAGWATS